VRLHRARDHDLRRGRNGGGASVDLDRVKRAATAIDPVFLRSPQFLAEELREPLGCDLVLKVESANPIRSFKGRGTDWLARCGGEGPLSCASAGNFGQGLAYAGRSNGREVHVFVAAGANPLNVERIRALGAAVTEIDGDFDDAREAVAGAAAERGWQLVVDGLDAEIAEGAGTMAIELAAYGTFDAVLVPVGNGSLICGVASWLKHVSPGTEVIAVGPEGAPAMERAWRTGDTSPGEPTGTIADGLASRVPVPEAVELMRQVVDRFVLVADDSMLRAVRLLYERCGLITEPSGAAGIAAAMELGDELRGLTVATPLCGSNVTPDLLARALEA
jgi:threonine dehydratase